MISIGPERWIVWISKLIIQINFMQKRVSWKFGRVWSSRLQIFGWVYNLWLSSSSSQQTLKVPSWQKTKDLSGSDVSSLYSHTFFPAYSKSQAAIADSFEHWSSSFPMLFFTHFFFSSKLLIRNSRLCRHSTSYFMPSMQGPLEGFITQIGGERFYIFLTQMISIQLYIAST